MSDPVKILIVEDCPRITEVLTRSLKREERKVVSATTVEHAVMMAGLFKPDAVVLDINLPDGNGLDSVPSLRDAIGRSEVPIIAISGSSENLEDKVREAGCTAFLRKPFKEQQLVDLISRNVKKQMSS